MENNVNQRSPAQCNQLSDCLEHLPELRKNLTQLDVYDLKMQSSSEAALSTAKGNQGHNNANRPNSRSPRKERRNLRHAVNISPSRASKKPTTKVIASISEVILPRKQDAPSDSEDNLLEDEHVIRATLNRCEGQSDLHSSQYGHGQPVCSSTPEGSSVLVNKKCFHNVLSSTSFPNPPWKPSSFCHQNNNRAPFGFEDEDSVDARPGAAPAISAYPRPPINPPYLDTYPLQQRYLMFATTPIPPNFTRLQRLQQQEEAKTAGFIPLMQTIFCCCFTAPALTHSDARWGY